MFALFAANAIKIDYIPSLPSCLLINNIIQPHSGRDINNSIKQASTPDSLQAFYIVSENTFHHGCDSTSSLI